MKTGTARRGTNTAFMGVARDLKAGRIDSVKCPYCGKDHCVTGFGGFCGRKHQYLHNRNSDLRLEVLARPVAVRLIPQELRGKNCAVLDCDWTNDYLVSSQMIGVAARGFVRH